MEYTSGSLKLAKPQLSDAPDITRMNPNWDKIDENISEFNDKINVLSENKLDGMIEKLGQSLNQKLDVGQYHFQNATDGFPQGYTTDNDFVLTVYSSGNGNLDWCRELLFDIRSNRIFTQRRTEGTLKGWMELVGKNYVDEQNELNMRNKNFATGTQIYTATKTGIYLSSNSDIVDLPEGWMQGRHCIATFNPNNDIYGFQLIASYPGGSGLGGNRRLAFRNSITEGSEWREVATTDKTEILCTANTGITIVSQNSYTSNGEFCIELRLKKTDDSSFGGSEVVVAHTPFVPYSIYPCNVIARTGSGSWNSFANAYITKSKEIRVCCNTGVSNNVTEFIISCKGGIQ